jgi:diguanylate cyclase (GGDEF)-like protein/PAS domain S-box-containing protein
MMEPPAQASSTAPADQGVLDGSGDGDRCAAELAAIVRESDDAIFEQDLMGIILRWNRAAGRIFGYSASEVLGQSGAVLVPVDLRHEEKSAFERVVAGRQVEHRRSRRQGREGATLPMALTIIPILGIGGAPVGALTIARDLTEEHTAQSTLAEAEARLREGEALAHVGSWTSDIVSGEVQWSEELYRVYDVALQDFDGSTEFCLSILHPEDREGVRATLTDALAKRQEVSFSYRVVTSANEIRHIHGRAQPQMDSSGRVVGLRGISQDVTDQHEAESDLRKTSEQLSQKIGEMERRNTELAMVREMSDMLQSCLSTEEAYGIIAAYGSDLFPGTDGVVYRPMSSLATLTGVASWGEASLHENVVDTEDCWALRRGRPHRATTKHRELECRHVQGDVNATNLCLPLMAHGELLGLLHLHQQSEKPDDPSCPSLVEAEQLAISVTEHLSLSLANLKLREHLKSQSEMDVLTGLFNRRHMDSCLLREMHNISNNAGELSLLLVDVDHFKRLNDDRGHAEGDTCLKSVAALLSGGTRGNDVVCRFGGDEFVIVLPEVGWETAMQRAEYIRGSVEEELGVTVSIGVASAPEDATTANQLLHHADINLYRAKTNGRNQVAGGANAGVTLASQLSNEARHD